MHTTNFKSPLLIIFGLVFFTTGAAGANQPSNEPAFADKIIGQWQEVDGLEALYFTKNHKALSAFSSTDLS